MGAITAAVSQKGSEFFLSGAIGDVISDSIKNQIIDYESMHKGKIGGTYIDDITIEVYNGRTSNISVSSDSSSFTQDENGQFTLQFNSSFEVKYDRWHESGTETIPGLYPVDVDFDDDCSDQCHFNVTKLPYTIYMTLTINNGNFVMDVTNVKQGKTEIDDIHIPNDSEIADIEDNVFVSDSFLDSITKFFVSGINFSSIIKTNIDSQLSFIPNSGHLTDDIIFYFAPEQIAFPKDSSGNCFTQCTMSGQVTYMGQPYPEQIPDSPPLSDNREDKDVHFNALDYVFNGLFWAYFSDGYLRLEVVPSMLADPEELNTSYYKDIYPEIYKFAPNCEMVVDVTAVTAPVKQNQAAYEVTEDTIINLKGQVPDSVLETLKNDMEGEIYIDLDDFEDDLKAFLGTNNYKLYGDLIVSQSHTVASIVIHNMLFDTYALIPDDDENYIKTFMFECTISQTDYLNEYVLGINTNENTQTQTLKFYFNLHSASTKLIESDVPGLADDFNSFWTFVIRPEMAKTIQKMGDQGVPLPFIQKYLFENSEIDLFEGFTSIASDIEIM